MTTERDNGTAEGAATRKMLANARHCGNEIEYIIKLGALPAPFQTINEIYVIATTPPKDGDLVIAFSDAGYFLTRCPDVGAHGSECYVIRQASYKQLSDDSEPRQGTP